MGVERKKTYRAVLFASVAGIALILGPAAIATTQKIEEVVVSATKTHQTLKDAPVAASVISANKIGPGGIQNIADLQAMVPNLSVGNQFGVARIFIRGIGMTSIDLGGDGAVAVLEDGAMIARPAAQLLGFYDLSRVEVLRGPQGTTYGRGATAGAINLVTAKPTDYLTGYAHVTAGNYSLFSFEGAVSGPLNDSGTLMGRLATDIQSHGGYGKNLFTGAAIDNQRSQAYRGTLEWKPRSDLDVELVAEYFREHDHNYAFHYFGTTVVPENKLAFNYLPGGQTIFGYYASLGLPPNLRNIYSDQEPINRRENEGITSIVTWTPGALTFTSTTAYRNFQRFNRDDLDAASVNMFGQNNYFEHSETFSQEFTADYEWKKLELLAGAMYFHERLDGEVLVPTTNLAVYFNGLLGTNLPANYFDSMYYRQLGATSTNAYGIYMQGTYKITPKLKVTAGARYNYEHKAGMGSFVFQAEGINVPTDKSRGWGAVTPKFTLQYQPTDNLNFYATVTRGFKSGTINIGSQNPVINPEYVWDYEGGVKVSALNDRLQFDTAAFYYDYKDLQVSFVNANSIVETRNAAAARNYGVEFDVTANPTDALTLNAYGTYLNAKFTNFCTAYYRQGIPPGPVYPACANSPGLVSLKGNTLPNAPDFSFGGGATYTVHLSKLGTAQLHADMTWQDKVYFNEYNNQDAVQGAYALVNALVRFIPAGNDHVSATLWVRNLTDQYALANDIITAPLYGSIRVGSLMPPRTFGVTLGYDF